VDINHCSLDKTTPLENQKAVGFFSLEVRAGELWATDCEWTPSTRVAFRAGEWKYFSPAYDVDVKTAEVVSFLNCALTNTPATWGVQALSMAASRSSSARTSIAAASIPTDVLRAVVVGEDRELAKKCKQELLRRGEQLTDPDTRDGQRLAGMLPRQGDGIVHGAKTSSFGVMTQEQAREHLAKKKR
jgi:hypothetical protein